MMLFSSRRLHEPFERIPTTDLYFLNPVRHLARGRLAANLPPIRNLAPNVYAIGRTGIISRYATAADLDRLQQSGVHRIVYIADDDFEAGAADAGLPASYRERLASFVDGAWPLLRAAADIVVVPGRVLGEIYGAKARVVPPAWTRAPADTRQFVQPRRIEIAHLGTGSHRADLAPIAGELTDLLRRHPSVRLTLFAGAAAPELANHPQIRARRQARWWRHKRMLPHMRFHLAIYPLRDVPFNAARSANKLYEQSLTGAAALMSPNPALRDALGAEGSAVFVEGGPDEWRRRMEEAIADLETSRRRAEAIRAHVLRADVLGKAARRWLDILAPET